MRFLTKIRDRQFAKKWGGAYNLSRAVLAGVLAAGCLMPGFAEAATLVTIPEGLIDEGLITVDRTEGKNIATITAVNGEDGDTRDTRWIFWNPGDEEAIAEGCTIVEGCTINVNDVNSTNNMTITPEIHVIGGNVEDSIAKSNTVNISNVIFTNSASIYGGYSDSGEANDNSVSISGGEFIGRVFGGRGETAANGNSVSISSGTFNYVFGGSSDPGEANGNQVIISGGTFGGTVESNVYGGRGITDANGNSVIISGGTFKNSSICGGYSRSGEANGNQVIISGGTFGGTVESNVYGGRGITDANGNSVIISGGEFNGNVYGGYSDSGTATNNKVILVGKQATYKFTDTQGTEQTLTGSGNINIKRAVYVGRTPSSNEIHVYGSNINVGHIDCFDKLHFFIDDKMTFGETMLTINGMSFPNETIYHNVSIPNEKLAVTVSGKPNPSVNNNTDNTITLVDYPNGTIDGFENDKPVDVKIGATLSGDGTVALEDKKNLVLTLNVEKTTVNENGKSLVETRAAAAFVVNNMSDFMLGTGMEQAKAAAGGVTPIDAGTMAPFAAVGGSNMRYTTGSYVDVNGWNGAVGFAKQADKLLFGVAVEHGRGNYDSYLDSGVHASGDIKSTGGVIFGEYKLDNGVHYDAALRAGRVKSDYSSTATSYDESSTYYGFSLGGGKELAVSDKATLDVYGRYYFSHTNGSDVSIATGEEIDFDAVNSHRVRIGGRYTTTLTEKSKAYAGLAWQYEFGGDAKAAINGYSAPTPSLQGHSAIVEAGYKLNAGKNLTLDFNLNGAMGKQRGIGGGIGAQWLF